MSTDPIERHFDLGSEQIVLGAMMTAPAVIADVEHHVKPESYYRHPHRMIHDAIVELAARQQPTDPVAVAAHLAGLGNLSKIGGASYLHDCIAAVPVAANAGHHARIIAGYATLRRLTAAVRRIDHVVATSGHDDADKAIQRALDAILTVEHDHVAEGPVLWADVIPGLIDEIEQAAEIEEGSPGVPTGLPDLDDGLRGLQPGQLIVVAARPGVGKSVLLMNIAQNAAMRHGMRTVVFSLEMRTNELGMRLLASGTRVSLTGIENGKLDDGEWARIIRYTGDTEKAPLHVDDAANLTLADIRARARRIQQQHGDLRLIVVDYLQLIGTTRSENRQVAVAALSRGLKLLGKELGVPVVVAAQLNRNPETRSDKRPTSSDLRESGAVEADADVIVLIHRDDAYDPESPRSGEADLIVDKNRRGPKGTVTVASQLHISRFASMLVVD